MKFKVITAITINTFGAAIIVVGAGLTDRVAAIAVSSLGYGISVLGVYNAIARDSKEVIRAKQEALYWAQEAQKHLQDKHDLLLQFQERNTQATLVEDQYEATISVLEIDEEWIEKMEKAQLN